MDRAQALASMLVDTAMVDALVPWACPCDFGPSGRYRLQELVAIGHHSLVYRAQDQHMASEGFAPSVAIKIVRSGSGQAREALAARRIGHPNVVSVFDHGQCEDGSIYIVSEYLSGGDLSKAEVPWAPRKAVAFVAKLAGAVQAAHSAGVVHCDLKPANVMISDSGEPKLVDFELAFWGSDEGSTRGNLAFMAPEQFRGGPEALTPPSDLYSLGGILYYLLTGMLPNGESREEVIRALKEGRAIPALAIDRDLDRIVARALSPDRNLRHHSAGEFAEDLERWLRHEPIPWTSPGAHRRALLLIRRRPVRSVIAAAVTVGLLATAGVLEYNAVQARREASRIEAEAQRRTKHQIEVVSERARASIRFLAQSVLASHPTDLQDRVLPILVWIQFLGDSAVLSEDARVPSVAEREQLLRGMVEEVKSDHREEHVDALLASYALAYFLVDEGQSKEPRDLLSDLRDRWTAKLAANDPIWSNMRGLAACADANDALARGEPVEQIRSRLQAVRADMDHEGRCEAVKRLSERLIDRLPRASR